MLLMIKLKNKKKQQKKLAIDFFPNKGHLKIQAFTKHFVYTCIAHW